MLKSTILLLVFSTIVIANGKPNLVDKEIMNHSLNYEFEEADRLLKRQYKKSEELKKHFLYLNIELIKVIKATDEVPFKLRRQLKDSLNQKLINYAEEIVEKYEDEELSLYDQFYFGSIHGLLGRLYGVSRSWMSAFSSGKEGRNIMQNIIEEDPGFIDAYLLVGMMNYYADRMGGIIEFVSGILGLSGDRNIGLEYLEKVEKEGDFNNWQATMILIELYSKMENNKFEALPLLRKMVQKFPKNNHFLNWYCYDLLGLYKMNEVGDILEKGSDEINGFIKAAYYHEKGEYEKSNNIYNKVFDEENLTFPWIFENAKFKRVLNYFMLNNNEKVEELKKGLNESYRAELNNILESPEFFPKLLKLKKAISFDIKEETNNFINNPPKFNGSEKAESNYNYYIAVHYFKEDKFADAEKYFLKAKEIDFNEFGFAVSRYLIHIYKTINVSTEKVENLLDDIDDLDNESLEFFAQDLEEKYDL